MLDFFYTHHLVSSGQCQEHLGLSNDEQALIPFSELQILNNTPCGSELGSSGVLAVQSPGQISNVSKQSNFLGQLSSNVMESGKAVVRVKNDQNTQTNDVLMKRMVIDSCTQPSLLTRDEQIDPVLGGVAEWEIPWEDLQIGERIGIGNPSEYSFSCLRLIAFNNPVFVAYGFLYGLYFHSYCEYIVARPLQMEIVALVALSFVIF